jgi:CheY-like chemotaxis protein
MKKWARFLKRARDEEQRNRLNLVIIATNNHYARFGPGMKIVYRSSELPELQSPYLIQGLPGNGYVGKLAIDHLIPELNANHLVDIYSTSFSPQIVIRLNGVAELMKNTIFYSKASSSGKNDLLLLTGDSQPENPDSEYLLIEQILDIAANLHQPYFSESTSASLNSSNYLQNQGSNLVTITETQTKEPAKPPFIKRILLVDDDPDITLTFKAGINRYYYGGKKRSEIYAYTDPLLVVKEFKPHFYDLLLTDINMPSLNGFELCEKILELDVNIRICFMTAFVINIRALREVYMNISFGCFIEKPVSIEYLINRLSAELD